MTKPFRSSGSDEWTSLELDQADIAAILQTLPGLPDNLKPVAATGVEAILFSWQGDTDTADDPTAAEAAAWFDGIERDTADLHKRLAAGPAALREGLHAAITARGGNAAILFHEIAIALRRLEAFAGDAAAVARVDQQQGRGGARRELSSKQRLCDAIFDLFSHLHERAPAVIGEPSWSLSGALPRFFNAIMLLAARRDDELRVYVADAKSALTAFKAGKVAFDSWRRRMPAAEIQ